MDTHEDNGQVCFNLEVRVPVSQVERFIEALTGHDDDILLAAEKAMRDRLGVVGELQYIEIWPSSDLKDALSEHKPVTPGHFDASSI